jgi:hypothetical protein
MSRLPVAMIGVTLLLTVISLRQGLGQITSPEGTARATVTVEATYPWVDSGLTVRKGERLSFVTSGTIHWGSKPDQVAGPEGHGAKPGKLGVGGLIGRVGFTGKPFAIGSIRTPVTMPQSGKLFLGINDFIFKDNAGSFIVRIFQPGV